MKFNRLNDLYFKYLLGSEQRKNLTLNFLNAILSKDDTSYFIDIEFVDKDIEPSYFDGKLSKLDIRGKLNDKTQVDIEVQVCPYKYMAERSLYYWSKMYADQLAEGEDYKKLQRAITINLLNFDYLKNEAPWHNTYHITNDVSGNWLTSQLEIHFLELPKFKMKDVRTIRKAESWMAYFSNKLTKKEMEAIAVNNPVMQEVLKAESYFTQDEINRRKYEQREKAIRDHYSFIAGALEEGFEKGRAEGEKEKAMSIAKNLLALDLPMETIAKATGLSEQEIDKLK